MIPQGIKGFWGAFFTTIIKGPTQVAIMCSHINVNGCDNPDNNHTVFASIWFYTSPDLDIIKLHIKCLKMYIHYDSLFGTCSMNLIQTNILLIGAYNAGC